MRELTGPDAVALAEAQAARATPLVLLDVREPWEVELVSLPGAVHIPLGELEQRWAELPTGPVTVYCHHGVRSAAGRDILLAHGVVATHLEGGIDAWAREHDPEMVRY